MHKAAILVSGRNKVWSVRRGTELAEKIILAGVKISQKFPDTERASPRVQIICVEFTTVVQFPRRTPSLSATNYIAPGKLPSAGMSLYHETASVLQADGSSGGNLRSRVFSRKDAKSPPTQVYALALETCKWSGILSEVIDNSQLLQHEKKVSIVSSSTM